MDSKIEGYLLAAMALIPAGVSMIMSAVGPDAFKSQAIGIAMIGLGLVAVALRGNRKENRVRNYVEKKIENLNHKEGK